VDQGVGPEFNTQHCKKKKKVKVNGKAAIAMLVTM
jgi:hypothetical protein